MKFFFQKFLDPGIAAWVCWAASLGAVALAFIGSERSVALMARPPAQILTAILLCWIIVAGLNSLMHRRAASTLLHLGCACVMAGWMIGRAAERHVVLNHPVSGAMAMVDGDVSDRLWSGSLLTNYVGRVPFTVKLEKFFVERYTRGQADLEAGRAAPVREYRSRIRIKEPDRDFYMVNVRVNQPAFVRGYHIYQMSWGHSQDHFGRPVTYTVLQFIRDPGLPVVYAGFFMLFVGILLYAIKVFRLKLPEQADPEACV